MMLTLTRLIGFIFLINFTHLNGAENSFSKKVFLSFPEVNVDIEVPIESPYELEDKKLIFNTAIVSDFVVPVSLEREANQTGHTFLKSESENKLYKLANDFLEVQLSWGKVYSWSTPTRGSSFYSYVCRKNEKFCFKIGPYTMLEFKWTNAVFKMKKKT